MKLHEAIRALRTSLGDTQSAFGKRTNLSSSSVAHFENGSRRPDPGSLVFLARAAFKVGRKDLAEIFVAELPGVSEELLIPVWRTNLWRPPVPPATDSVPKEPARKDSFPSLPPIQSLPKPSVIESPPKPPVPSLPPIQSLPKPDFTKH
jgi:transcriptional regulator with XRE-family HTH domain